MGKKNWLLTFLVSYKNWLLAVRNLKSLKILLRKHERYRQDTKLIHNIASGMIMMMMMMMMMMMHISVNFCFFFFSEHSEENYENVELDGSNQSEIQSRYFSEYKPRPYCYIPMPVLSTQNKRGHNMDSERHTEIKFHNFLCNIPLTSIKNSTWLHVSTSVGHCQADFK